jgi:hypothetical protein
MGFLRFTFQFLAFSLVAVQLFSGTVFAQGSTGFTLGSPVNYDSTPQIGRGFQDADSIDSCMQMKEFNFNEIHNIWVDGMVRCKYNSKRVLSRATAQGVSTAPEDEQACSGRREGQLIVQGTPSEIQARRWSERCSYLGTLGGAGPLTTNNPTGTFPQPSSSLFSRGSTTNQNVNSPTTTNTQTQLTRSEVIQLLTERGDIKQGTTPSADIDKAVDAYLSSRSTSTDFSPVYDGRGVQVPGQELLPSGISTKTSLAELIVFYTNATLPYVSVIAVFAFVAAGLFYILSFTNEELSGKAKNMMLYVVIGIVIIFSAYTIVNTLFSFITFQ